jgi:hypothetical protein
MPRPVGGIVRIWPDDPDPHTLTSGSSSGRQHAVSAGVLAVGAIILGTGAWYARRRWLR